MLEDGMTITCVSKGHHREFAEGMDYIIERIESPPRDERWFRLRAVGSVDALWISQSYLNAHFIPKTRTRSQQVMFPTCHTARRTQRDAFGSIRRQVALQAVLQRSALVQHSTH